MATVSGARTNYQSSNSMATWSLVCSPCGSWIAMSGSFGVGVKILEVRGQRARRFLAAKRFSDRGFVGSIHEPDVNGTGPEHGKSHD
jgi:hypothetical protein